MSTESLRQSILAMAGRLAEQEAEMPGPEGPVKVIVRELTGRESQVFQMSVRAGKPNTLGMLLCMVVRDPETKDLVFGPADRAAVEELGVTALNPLAEIVAKMNGLTDADVEKAKEGLAPTPASV